MALSRFSATKRDITVALFGGRDWDYFWESRFLPRWLPVTLGFLISPVAAYLVANEQWYYVAPIVLLIPAAILFNRYPFIAVMLWMGVLPYFLNEISPARRFIYWIVHRGVILAAVGIVILSYLLGTRKRVSLRLGRAELSTLLFLGLTLVNIFLLSRNTKRVLIEFYDQLIIPIAMYWLIRLVAPGKKDLERFLWVAFVTLIAQCVIGLLSWFAPEVLPPQWINLHSQGARTVGSLRIPGTYTSTLLFLALLLFQYAMNCRAKWLYYTLLSAFALAFFCVFFSFSRGSWVGSLIVLIGLTFLYPKVISRLVIVFLMCILVLNNSILASEINWGYERLTGEDAQRSADNRVVSNYATFEMIKASPIWGWGFNNYDLYIEQFVNRVEGISATLGYGVTSHNTYLTIMAELGLPSLLLYLFPAWWWFILSLKVWKRMPSQGFYSKKLLVMLWLLLTHMFVVTNFTDMIRFHIFGTTVWWMALGFAANMARPHLGPNDVGVPKWAHSNITP